VKKNLDNEYQEAPVTKRSWAQDNYYKKNSISGYVIGCKNKIAGVERVRSVYHIPGAIKKYQGA
jgi:hypothetical protein